MFCVFLKFPHEHQIKKINSTVIPVFLKVVEGIAKDNGCKKIVKRDAYFYFFEHSFSSSFFTSRFLYTLSLSLKQFSSIIHESFVIVEHFSNEDTIEYLNELQNTNLNFNNILVGADASKYFKKYISLIPSKTSSFKVCKSFSFFEDIEKEENSLEGLSLFFRKDQNYIQVLYDFILGNPILESDVAYLSKQEAKTYLETKHVLSFYSRNRFNSSLPKYFLDAFIIYAKLHIKIYKKFHKNINIYTDCLEENIEIEKLKQILKDVKVLKLPKKEIEIEKIPDDLFEAIYILIFSVKFIFSNEVEDFFFTITETKAFKDLMEIMYKRGIILKKDCIFSYQNEAIKEIEKKLKGKRYNSIISKYIWLKYKNAEISCDFNLRKIFDVLKFQYDMEFNIEVFFNLKKHYILLNSDRDNVNFENIDVLKKYESIIKFKDKGKLNEAFIITKDLNSYFHNEKILSGEYRSCSLLGLLFLENNNIGEALTYFGYSLEIARKVKNLEFICEALCYLSMVYFLQKDFQKCSVSLQELSNSISFFFMMEWKVFYLFIQGRVFIELGEMKKASVFFKLAKDFSTLYFNHLEDICDIWYGRALIYEGKVEKGRKILNSYSDIQAVLFSLESFLLFPKTENNDIILLKEKYDVLCQTQHYDIFPFFEDIIWHKIYKQAMATRLFETFYSYYVVMFSSTTKKSDVGKHLKKLEEIAMNSLYSKDNTASIYLYLSYSAECKIAGGVTDKALGFLSKACNIMQKNTNFMYESSMRDKFMKENIWNSKLFEAAKENKLM